MNLRRGKLQQPLELIPCGIQAVTSPLGIVIAFRAVVGLRQNGRLQAPNPMQGLLQQVSMEEKLFWVCAQLGHSL